LVKRVLPTIAEFFRQIETAPFLGCAAALVWPNLPHGWLILGLIAGFIVSKIVNKSGEGLILDIVLDIVGAFVGGFLFSFFGAAPVTGLNIYSTLSPPFILCNSILGLGGVLIAGQQLAPGTFVCSLAALVGAVIGTAVGRRWMSERRTRYVLAAILLFAGIRLLFR
jgi:uncharacterized membrane protein YeaQ/YmgE (transglycosylase-associated protein family)